MTRRSRVPPHDLEAEESLLGAMLMNRDAIGLAKRRLSDGDFYKPGHRQIFAAIVVVFDQGAPVDVVSVGHRLAELEQLDLLGGRQTLARLIAGVPASFHVEHYVQLVRDDAIRRRVIDAAGDMAEIAYEGAVPLSEQIDRIDQVIAKINVPLLSGVASLDVDSFMNVGEEHDWLVDGLLERLDRVIIVAPEGFGKTLLLLQLAVQLAAGVHPWTYARIEPHRVLVGEFEVPTPKLRRALRMLVDKARDSNPDFDPQRLQVISRPSGIDVTQPGDRGWLLEQVMYARPDVVCAGPLYKLHESDESDQQSQRQIAKVLDEIRVQQQCALLLETHAPHSDGGKKRRMRPIGSTVWLRWPEHGLGLEPEGDGFTRAYVSRWRGARDDDGWPTKLKRGGKWPWSRDDW